MLGPNQEPRTDSLSTLGLSGAAPGQQQPEALQAKPGHVLCSPLSTPQGWGQPGLSLGSSWGHPGVQFGCTETMRPGPEEPTAVTPDFCTMVGTTAF